MLGLVKQTIKHRHPDMMVQLYKSLVRPHLEYCLPVWSPHYRKDVILLQKVQHRFTRFFDNLKDLEYNERLRKLKLWTLQEKEPSRLDRTVQDGARHFNSSIGFVFPAS